MATLRILQHDSDYSILSEAAVIPSNGPASLFAVQRVSFSSGMFKVLIEDLFFNFLLISRHTVVCRAAQEAGAPHREYIYRKKENVIFTPLYLGDPLSDYNQI